MQPLPVQAVTPFAPPYAHLRHALSWLQAVAPYESSLLSGSLRVVSRGKELAQQFDTRRDLVYEVEAEIGEMGLRFTQDYKGLKIEVDAVLNQSREDFELERAILLCAPIKFLVK